MLLLGLFIIQTANSQKSVRSSIQPSNTTVRINGNLIEKGNQETFIEKLEVGDHPIEIWAPEFELVRDIVIQEFQRC